MEKYIRTLTVFYDTEIIPEGYLCVMNPSYDTLKDKDVHWHSIDKTRKIVIAQR